MGYFLSNAQKHNRQIFEHNRPEFSCQKDKLFNSFKAIYVIISRVGYSVSSCQKDKLFNSFGTIYVIISRVGYSVFSNPGEISKSVSYVANYHNI